VSFDKCIYVAVVSHNHLDTILELNILPEIAKVPWIKVFLLDNIPCPAAERWCLSSGISYLPNKNALGFGENNNIIFNYICQLPEFNLELDWFLVLNPDVSMTVGMFKLLIDSLDDQYPIFAVNLYKDQDGLVSDDSIRRFPSLVDFVSSLLFGINRTKIDKSSITQPCSVDWAAGSFLVFKASHYARLGGFDSSYFMYCEDIDICFRSAVEFGCRVRYLPHVKARHLAQHGNRKIFSKHFYWHISSSLRFLWRSRKARKLLSISNEGS
jgi:GT2 family glycosyltransferase